MPQQRSSGQKTPTGPTKIPGMDSSASSKFSPQSSSFEDQYLMMADRDYGPSGCCFSGCAGHEGGSVVPDQGTVKVTCCKEGCGGTGWMHGDCWKLFEESTDKITPNGKSAKGRSWNEKQKVLKSSGGKKGSWECSLCSKNTASDKVGDSSATVSTAPVKFSGGGKRAKAKKQGSCGSTGSSCSSSSSSSSASSAARLSASFQHQLSFDGTSSRSHHSAGHARSRTLSLCSAGSSPPNCSDDVVASLTGAQSRFEFFADPLQAAVGNIFGRRFTLDAFGCLPQHQQNPYQIKVEDEGPHGNDEIRSFILTTLSGQRVTSVSCCTCGNKMAIFDKYPLVDGTFFLSPLCYSRSDNSFTPTVDKGSRKQYINSICVECLSADLSSNPLVRSKCLHCSFCERVWSGSRFLMGSMYSYDIFSAVPCCQARLLCNSCGLPVIAYDSLGSANVASVSSAANNAVGGSRCFPGYPNGLYAGGGLVGFSKMNGGIAQNGYPVVPGTNGLKFFSDYSKRITCPHCNVPDFHFVKPLSQVFYKSRPLY